MLPQVAYQQHRIIQTEQDGHHLDYIKAESMRLQQLPFRASIHTSKALAPPQRGIPVNHAEYKMQNDDFQIADVENTHLPDRSEHMLRRKTPNGTLAAGYDGTPVRWSTKPPPAKHVVLPLSRSSSMDVSCYKTEPASPPHHMQGNHDISWKYSTAEHVYDCSEIMPSSVLGDWTRLPPLVNDHNTTILDRLDMHQGPACYHYDGNAMQIPTVLQPPFQPCSGPTASDDGGFYGPYWPDGKLVPYRPAAFRHTSFPSPVMLADVQQELPSLKDGNSPNYYNDGLKSHSGISKQYQDPPNQFESGYRVEGDSISETHAYSIHQQTSLSAIDDFSAQGLRATHSPAFPFFGKHHNFQFKEKALAWAHSVYVDLLAYLHHSKKGSQHTWRSHGLGRSFPQTNLYPKPPMQLSFMSTMRAPTESLRKTGSGAPGHTGYVVNSGRRSSHPVLFPKDKKKPFGSSSAVENAKCALEMLTNLCQESNWRWIDGMLLGGCLAYGLEDYNKALNWYTKIVSVDPSHVEGISNLAATLLSLNRREEAEQYWLQSVKLRPSYFEAVEHLIALLCGERRGGEAICIIEFVERSLRISTYERPREEHPMTDNSGMPAVPTMQTGLQKFNSISEDLDLLSPDPSLARPETDAFDFKRGIQNLSFGSENTTGQPGFGSSGYAIPASDNGRILALVHAKGNMLYAMGDIAGAERAFEDAVLISTGRRLQGIRGLIEKIVQELSRITGGASTEAWSTTSPPLLLPPDKALQTAKVVFKRHGELPGLHYVPDGIAKTAAISTTSNSLLSLAKIFQDGMSNTQPRNYPRRPSGVGDILALYYLSLSLQPSPSTANNVGILLASVQQSSSLPSNSMTNSGLPIIPGVIPGSGVALALAYYNYGLNLDSRHAHLYTNLGSLLKDIGQLPAAIKMYEQAVSCDNNFDIALANLANAVKDLGRISDAIGYYRRAVASSPDFAEAVCGLANALNSVCDWTGRGGVFLDGGRLDRWHVNETGMLCDAEARGTSTGWMRRVVEIVGKQLQEGANWGRGTLQDLVIQSILRQLEVADSGGQWSAEKFITMRTALGSWYGQAWEGSRIVRLVERATRRATHRWYKDKFIHDKRLPLSVYSRPRLPDALSIPGAPTVLPFHTFTCPLSAKDIRMISQRNALRISCSTLKAPWLPVSVYPPPPPPRPSLNIGYVSSDFNNHPLAHLMQSVFGLHDCKKVKAICYATTASDHSVHRQQIEREAPVFRDASNWSPEALVRQILKDEVHILVNLNGYTRGARNEVFAARAAPIQMSFMGFAGTLGAEWCDYLLADQIAIPPNTLRPWRRNIELEDQLRDDQASEAEDWVYSENIIFCRDTFFCCDHRQSSPDPQIPWEEEQKRRWRMRKELFPSLSDDAVILGNFNQLYKIEPTTFRTWLRVLANVPRAILWLLRFPDLGESNLKRTARLWAGEEVASRIWFTDVAPKNQHISRARVCDLFLDTPECNAHTTAADVLWSSTPLLTLPRYKYKMCSRMAASILTGALPKTVEGRRAATELIAEDEAKYEHFAIKLASGLVYNSSGVGAGRLSELRRLLYESRSTSALFDTKRWVSDLELAYREAWRRWVHGVGGDIYL